MQGNGDGTLADTQQVERRRRIIERPELAGHGIALGVKQASEEFSLVPALMMPHRDHWVRDRRYSHKAVLPDTSVSDAYLEGAPNVIGIAGRSLQNKANSQTGRVLKHPAERSIDRTVSVYFGGRERSEDQRVILREESE